MGSAEQYTRGLPLSHAAMRLLIILLRFLFAPPRFGFDRMTGPKLSNLFQGALLFGATMIFPMIRTSNNLQLDLALEQGRALIELQVSRVDATMVSTPTLQTTNTIL